MVRLMAFSVLSLMRFCSLGSEVFFGYIAPIETVVPNVENTHLGILGHFQSIRTSHSFGSGLSKLWLNVIVASGQHKTGSKPLHVPLPWSRQSLVKVIDVKNDVALGSGESTKIKEMGVAASLSLNLGDK